MTNRACSSKAEPAAHNCQDVGSSPTTPTIHSIRKPSADVLAYICRYYEYKNGKLFSTRSGYRKEIGHYVQKKNRFIVSVSLGKRGKIISISRAHIVWYLCKKEWPTQEIDHIDRNSTNDNIENLRYASRNLQAANVSRTKVGSNYRGCYRVKNGWQVQLWKDGKRHLAGWHKELDDAVAAFEAKYLELWGTPYK